MSERELRDELEQLSAKVLAVRKAGESYSHEFEVTEAVRAAKAATPQLEERLARAREEFQKVSRELRLLRASVEEVQRSLDHARAEIVKREHPGDPLEGTRL